MFKGTRPPSNSNELERSKSSCLAQLSGFVPLEVVDDRNVLIQGQSSIIPLQKKRLCKYLNYPLPPCKFAFRSIWSWTRARNSLSMEVARWEGCKDTAGLCQGLKAIGPSFHIPSVSPGLGVRRAESLHLLFVY